MRKVKLNELGEIITGNTPPTNNTDFYENPDIPFYKPNDLDNDIVTILNSASTYIDVRAKNKLRILPQNTVLVTCIGTIGKVGITNNFECATNQQINAIIPNKQKCHCKYIAYAIFSIKKQMQDNANAPVVPIINKKDFSAYEIPLPSLDEQKRIADKLDKISALIAKRKTQIEKLDLLVKAKFVEMFGDPIKNPKKWVSDNLKNITTSIQSGNTPKGGKKVYVESGIMLLRSQNVWKNRILVDDIVFIDKETHKKMKNTSLETNDILITKTGRFNTENSSLGRAALYTGGNDAANINGHVYLIRLINGISHKFVLHILTSDEYREYIRNICIGGIDKRQINKEHLEEFPIILPPLSLQTQFANYVTKVEEVKAKMQAGLAQLETLYKSQMQKYFG